KYTYSFNFLISEIQTGSLLPGISRLEPARLLGPCPVFPRMSAFRVSSLISGNPQVQLIPNDDAGAGSIDLGRPAHDR
ncbi:hypothetical protein, partial [Streptococcus pneumoniae]|uniref:hypothetical protein n=1 Tax=Streptococcus pneumoniae TaxID=1313 RepID=UPI00195479DE